VWGAAFPLAIVVSAIAGGVAMALAPNGVDPFVFALSIAAAGAMIYVLKIMTAAAANGIFKPSSWVAGARSTLRHFFEYAGVSQYWFSPRKGAKA
jgi:hypothetical protein